MDKVVIGMSGGVDSSVAALILKNKGYEVIGVTLNVWQDDNLECGKQAMNDAKAIADKLEIEYHVVDYKEKFKSEVISKFIKEYTDGKTPNPCNICNRFVKFNGLLEYAKSIVAKYIATGHYANIEYDDSTGRYYIKRAATDKKDQTYALYNLTQEQLSHILMPLGKYEKEDVRKIAEENGLINANKKDSQEICFVPDKDYAKYIEKSTGFISKEGNFVDVTGKIYGKHKGIIHYTVGQRKGLGLSLKEPMYVLSLNKDTNTVLIGTEKQLEKYSLTCCEVNLMSISELKEPMRVSTKIRYNAKLALATIIPLPDNCIKVVFDSPVKGVAPGQACVFYDGDKLLGGGIIMQD